MSLLNVSQSVASITRTGNFNMIKDTLKKKKKDSFTEIKFTYHTPVDTFLHNFKF